jgi:MFS family permease
MTRPAVADTGGAAASPVDTGSEYNTRSLLAALAAWLGMFIGPNALVSAPMSLFIAPLKVEFGLSSFAVSSILVISPFATAACSLFVGRAMDRWGLRRVLLPGVLLFGVAGMARGVVHAPWQLGLSFLVVSMASAMTSAVGYAKLVSLWFGANRGKVLSLVVALGAGLGSALTPQVVRLLIHNYDWRVAYISLGAYVLILPLPLLFLLVREPQGARAGQLSQHHSDADLPGLTRHEAVRSRSFWLLWFAIFLASMALIGTTSHAVPMLTERGFTSLVGTTAISCFFFGGIAGQLTSGWIADRIDSPRTALPYFIAALAGALMVHTVTSKGLLLSGALLMGMGQGAEIAFAAYLTSRYFGLKAYGSIYGVLFASSTFGIGTGLMLMGLVHDFAGSYRPMKFVFGTALLISVVLVGLLGPYAFASRKALTAAAGK